MIEERETELEDLFYNFDVGFDQLTSDLDFITKENQIDGHFVMYVLFINIDLCQVFVNKLEI